MAVNTCGDLKTKIRIQYLVREVRQPGQLTAKAGERWIDIGNQSPDDPDKIKYGNWQNLFGNRLTDILTADQSMAKNMATVTVRYDSRIDANCRVIRVSEISAGLIGADKSVAENKVAYAIVNVDNYKGGNQFQVLTLRRMEAR